MQGDDLGIMFVKLEDACTRSDIPYPRRVVRGTRGQKVTLRIEGHANDLLLVTDERVQAGAGHAVPNLALEMTDSE
jgi:hypothetical protein